MAELLPRLCFWLLLSLLSLSTALLVGCQADTLASQSQATAPQSGANPGPSAVSYVFTVDGVKQTASEFALSTSGQLQPTSQSVPNALPTATAHGIVYTVPGQSAGANVTLQSYSLNADGSLQPQGSAVSYPQDKVSNLVSDDTYVYAVSDSGIFGFKDQSTGLMPLAATQQTVPSPCPPAQEDVQYGCGYSAALMLSDGSAFLSERAIPPYGTENTFPQLSEFNRSQGVLTDQQLLSSYVGTYLITATPDGRYLYLLEWISNRILRYDISGTSSQVYDVLSNGQQLQSPATSNLLVTPDGAFLLDVIANGANPGQVRVFKIDSASGTLTEVTGSPFSTGENYLLATALDATGHYLLATHGACSMSGDPNCTTPAKLVAMSIDSSTGALAVTADVADGVNPWQVTAAVVSH